MLTTDGFAFFLARLASKFAKIASETTRKFSSSKSVISNRKAASNVTKKFPKQKLIANFFV